MGERLSVSELLDGHVTLEVECFDRLYLNGYVQNLQTSGGVVLFLRAGRRRWADAIPLAFYLELSVATLVSDSLDRFGTRRERRYRRTEVPALLHAAGFAGPVLSKHVPYRHAYAVRP